MKKTRSRLSKKMELMLVELSNNYCNITEACKVVGIARQTHYDYLSNEKYLTHYEEIQEMLLDRAESALHEQLKENPQLLQFFLKTKGKKRGYSETQKVEVSSNYPTMPPLHELFTVDDENTPDGK